MVRVFWRENEWQPSLRKHPFLLALRGWGRFAQERNRERRRNFTDEQRERAQERNRKWRRNFTDEQREKEQERDRERRRNLTDEQRER